MRTKQFNFKDMSEALKDHQEKLRADAENKEVEAIAEKVDIFSTLKSIEKMASDAIKDEDMLTAVTKLLAIAKLSANTHKEIKKRLKI